MTDQGSPAAVRLDSWKAIADYLGRDVATVRRWERLHQLPVRRIAGRGRSVFAFTSEIDAWLTATPPAEMAATPVTAEQLTAAIPEERRTPRWLLAAAAVVVASGLLWIRPLWTSEPLPIRAEMTPSGIDAWDTSGARLWHHPFSPDDRISPKATFSDVRAFGGDEPGVMAATAYYERARDGDIRSGQLLWLNPNGSLARTFSFDDQVRFGTEVYGRPWDISDFKVDERGGVRRIAVTAHHDRLWPSLVTVLDAKWQRTGTFVSAGWIEQVYWLSSDRLLISGFANAHDGGMVAMLDAGAFNGQSPAGADPAFSCTSCGSAAPIRYVVMPRSEVNKASGSRLNGALVKMQDGRILVRTVEMTRDADSAEVLYEFSSSLELISAAYGDRYWEAHRALEAEGRLHHTRAQCPDRNGPRGLPVWEPAAGWQTVVPTSSVSAIR